MHLLPFQGPTCPRRSVGGPPPALVGSDYLGLFVEEDMDGPTQMGVKWFAQSNQDGEKAEESSKHANLFE